MTTDLRDAIPGALVETLDAGRGGRWLIRVIRAGLSKNGNYYPDAALREAAGMFAGARVFEKSDAEHLRREGKSVRNLIGGLANPKFVEGRQGADSGEVVAELVLIDPAGPVAAKLRGAHERGLSGLFGFSIDADGRGGAAMLAGRPVRRVEALSRVHSVDLIIEPGAGGQLITMVEAVADGAQQSMEKNMELRQMIIAAIQAKRPDYTGDGVTDEQLLKDYRAIVEPEKLKDAGEPGANAKEQAKQVIEASNLPAYGKARLLERFTEAAEPFDRKAVIAAIEAERDYLARSSETGKVNMGGLGGIEVEDRGARVADMLDAFFDTTHKNHGAVLHRGHRRPEPDRRYARLRHAPATRNRRHPRLPRGSIEHDMGERPGRRDHAAHAGCLCGGNRLAGLAQSRRCCAGARFQDTGTAAGRRLRQPASRRRSGRLRALVQPWRRQGFLCGIQARRHGRSNPGGDHQR
jgi:hypothetical protein